MVLLVGEIPDFAYGLVKALDVRVRSIHELLLEMSNASFQGRALGEAYRVLICLLYTSPSPRD